MNRPKNINKLDIEKRLLSMLPTIIDALYDSKSISLKPSRSGCKAFFYRETQIDLFKSDYSNNKGCENG